MIDNIKKFFIGLCYVAGCYLVIIAVVVIYTYVRKDNIKITSIKLMIPNKYKSISTTIIFF
mgnify:CR=1 FL=1